MHIFNTTYNMSFDYSYYFIEMKDKDELQDSIRFWNFNVQHMMYIFIAVLGSMTNLITCVALLRQSKLRNVKTSFIVSLSMADLIFCSILLPMYTSTYYGSKIGEIKWLCQLVPFALYSNFGTSILSIVMITINRYVKVAHPFKYAKIYNFCNTAMMIAFTWIAGYAFQLPTLLGKWGRFGYSYYSMICDNLQDSEGNSSRFIMYTLVFLLPCIPMIYCYSVILWLFIKSKRNMRTLGSRVNGENVSLRRELKKTKIIFVIFITFIVCFLPSTIFTAIENKPFFQKLCYNSVLCAQLRVLCFFLMLLSTCVNPFIYGFMNLQYREAYVDLFKSMFKPCRRIMHRNDRPLN